MANTSSIPHQLGDIAAPLRALLGDLRAEEVLMGDAVDVWTGFLEIRRLADAGVVLMADRVAQSRQWATDGAHTPAEWMALHSGSTVGRSRSELGTSGRLKELPLTAGQLRAGNLTAEQADAVTDAAATNPTAEADLLDQAKRDSLKNLRDEAERRKAQGEHDAEAKRQRIHQERSARFWVKDGTWHLHANGPTDTGAELQQAVERIINTHYQGAAPATGHEPRDAYAHDALINLARHATSATGTGTGESQASPGTKRRTTTPGDPHAAATRTVENIKRLMLIRVDLTALIRGSLNDGELCEIAGLGPISVEQARNLMGESILKAVLTNGVDVANITHLGRGPNTAQHIALLWQQPTCTRQGCNRTVLQHDHRIDYRFTHHTRLDELDNLCKPDHDLKTHHGWALTPGTGPRPMVPPNHPQHPNNLTPHRQTPLFGDTG